MFLYQSRSSDSSERYILMHIQDMVKELALRKPPKFELDIHNLMEDLLKEEYTGRYVRDQYLWQEKQEPDLDAMIAADWAEIEAENERTAISS
jgi:hypothetical protein